MARSARNSKVDSRSARSKLPARKAPYRARLEPGQALGYYKPAKGAGSWIALLNPGKDDEGRDSWKQKALGTADDLIDSDGEKVLSYSEAQAKAREWFRNCADEAAQSAAGVPIRSGPYTVSAALDDYLEDALRRGMKAVDRTRCAIDAHIRPVLGAIEVTKLSRERIEAWHLRLAESARRVRVSSKPAPTPRNFKVPRPAKPKAETPAPPASEEEKRARRDTANRILTILKAALNHALDRGRVKHGDAWQAVKPFKGTTSARVRFLSHEEQVRLVNACLPDFRRLVKAALYTGARYGELGRLQVKDFNAQAGTLWIAPGKTDKGRHVVLTEEGQIFFTEVTAGRDGEALMLTREGVTRRGRHGQEAPEGWKGNDQQWLLRAACETAKLGDLTFHELRHTYASGLVNRGVPLAFVAELLGHTDIRMVSKHYGHLAPNALAEAVRSLAPRLGLEAAPAVQPMKIGLA